ncbi:MAG: SCO family protein [Campylobacterota bacterium]|nr:SCO family protein [Campylobacterota bacterium]
MLKTLLENKKRVLATLLFTLLLLGIPLLQSIFFSSRSGGKIIINKEVSAPFLNSATKPYVLMMFGYVGCVDVCTPLLENLDAIYESPSFKVIHDDVDIFFINLTPEINTEQPNLFANAFNVNFKGVYLSRREILTIEREFLLFHSRSLSDVTQLNHSDYIYLLEQKVDNSFVLKNIYSTHPLNIKELKNDIITLTELH